VFTSSTEVFFWLAKFINLERGQKPKSFRLDRMEALMELAGRPERCAPSIHVAGSKGKGSVTGMLSAMLTAAGFRVARYMSPHVIDIRERICLGDSYFSEEIYCVAGNDLREITEIRVPAAANPLFDNAAEDGCEPTYFELLTLFFFLCARRGKCDVMTVETGMGGRLDSTNVLDPLVSVITIIELEHTFFLGNTIAAVAGEKAGIIKHGKPLILAKQSKEALEVFRKKTEEKNSPLFYLPEIAELSGVKVSSEGTDFTLSFKAAPPLSLSIPVPGKVQAENAALAIAAVKTAFPQIGEDVICKGLKNFHIPARFEKIGKEPPFIIDGAHTPESLALCIETFCSLYGEGGVLLFGCAADKDAAAMARIAVSHFSKIIITTPGTFKISNPALVYEVFTAQAGQEKTLLVEDTQEAVRQAVYLAENFSHGASHGGTAARREEEEEKVLPILGTGSFYLVSEIRKIFVS
jgi:dihydrofolate synthase/folylpolyglutamate synthase